MRRESVKLWTWINATEDGTPLLGIPGAGPAAVLIGVGALAWGCFC